VKIDVIDLIKKQPYQALKVFHNRDLAEQYSASFVTDGAFQGCQDAFRHAFFNVLNSQDL
jgi:hypothetical protein